MRIFFLFLYFMTGAACSSSSDIIKTMGLPQSAYLGPSPLYRSTAVPATAGVGTALLTEDFAIEATASTPKNGLVPITVTGLDLLSGETATIFTNDCEAMKITNHGDIIIRRFSTHIRMTKSTTANGIVRVESTGRSARSKPIKATASTISCNDKPQLDAISEFDFSRYADKSVKPRQTIKLDSSFNQGTANINAYITHPMQSIGKGHPHYITNLSMRLNNNEIISINSSPLLADNPQFGLTLDTVYVNDEITVLWRDNKDKVDKKSMSIRFN